VKVDPKLDGQRKEKEKVFCLVANGRRKRRFFVWWPMEGEGKGFLLGGQWEEKQKVLFHLFPLFPKVTLFKPSFFSFDIKVLLFHGFRPLFAHSLPFPWPINYNCVFLMS
jgi:hypothetical protein